MTIGFGLKQILAIPQNKRGVIYHVPKSIKLYEKLVHPPDEVREEITENLRKILDKILGKVWRIFEPGIGGGWLTFKLLESIKNCQNDHEVLLVGVDTCPNMLTEFIEMCKKENIASVTFPHVFFYNKKNITIVLDHKDVIEFINLENQHLKHPKIEKFNVIFCFFLLHHLRDWQEGLKKIVEVMDEHGIIVISEVEGDQAAWSGAFHKIFNLKIDITEKSITEESITDERLQYIHFIKKFQEECERIGWFNYTPVSAADVSFALDWLNSNNFTRIDTISVKYVKEIQMIEWFKAGGLLPINDGDYDRAFSVFPPFISNDERERFNKKIYNKDIQNLSVRISEKLNYHIFKK